MGPLSRQRWAGQSVWVCALLWLAGCEAPSSRSAVTAARIVVADDAGDTTRLDAAAARIVSLVPSATELLLSLGVGSSIVGRTRYDVDPRVAQAADVGGGLDPNIEAIVGLRPDLVISWASGPRSDLASRLRATGTRVFAIAPQDTGGVYRSLARLAQLTARDSAARVLADSLRRTLAMVAASVRDQPRPRVFYVVGIDPPLSAGPRTFIGQALSIAGAENVVTDAATDWPSLSFERIVAQQPDIIVLPVGESADARAATMRERAGWKELAAVRNGRVITIDANLANRPGPRMGELVVTLRALLHPRDSVTTR
jgi:iron complex transport system substrate-binding protein